MSQNFSPALSPKSRAGRKWMGGGAPIAKVGPSAKVRRFQANLRIRIAVGQDILHCPSPTLRRHWHNATKAARVPLVAFVARSQREPTKRWHWVLTRILRSYFTPTVLLSQPQTIWKLEYSPDWPVRGIFNFQNRLTSMSR